MFAVAARTPCARNATQYDATPLPALKRYLGTVSLNLEDSDWYVVAAATRTAGRMDGQHRALCSFPHTHRGHTYGTCGPSVSAAGRSKGLDRHPPTPVTITANVIGRSCHVGRYPPIAVAVVPLEVDLPIFVDMLLHCHYVTRA